MENDTDKSSVIHPVSICERCGHKSEGDYYKVIIADIISESVEERSSYNIHRGSYRYNDSRTIFICNRCKRQPSLFGCLTQFSLLFLIFLSIVFLKFAIFFMIIFFLFPIVCLFSGVYSCDERRIVKKKLPKYYKRSKIKCFKEEEWDKMVNNSKYNMF